MTLLTKNSLSEFDTMSLFQDLKLKRRKIDSRCSSDGESVADTSTSSPDLPGPISPSTSKMDVSRISPSPATLSIPSDNRVSSPDSGLSDGVITESSNHKDHDLCNSKSFIIAQKIKEEPNNGVFDGGGSPPLDEGGGDVKENINGDMHDEEEEEEEDEGVIRNREQQRRESVVVSSASALAAWNAVAESQKEEIRLNNAKSETGNNVNGTSSSSTSSNGSTSSNSSTSSLCSEVPVASPAAAGLYCSVISSPPKFWVTTGAAAPSVLQACRINGVRPELIGGVNYCESMKPPVMLPQRPTSSGLRTTPTVIMGEAGGVRTMIWSTPLAEQQQQQQQQAPQQQPSHIQQPMHQQTQHSSHNLMSAPQSTTTWTQTQTSPSLNVAETEAQLLLNLGQEIPNSHLSNIRPLVQHIPHQQNLQQHSPQERHPTSTIPLPLNMERLWAGDLSQLPPSQQIQALNLSTPGPPIPPWPHFLKNNGDVSSLAKLLPSSHHNHEDGNEEEEQPMICMICEDKATGLHYGIITCEGCKGFFKRTVQNRRVYTCVADGVCEITKAQRNRCQYCRFKKCLEQGMVLQAVREDRMPGGRNSGAVYNLYKVKYKKHKKATRNGQIKVEKPQQQHIQSLQQSHHQQQQQSQQHHIHSQTQLQHQQNQMQQSQQQSQQPQKFAAVSINNSEHGVPPHRPHLFNGTILKTALTNPSEVVYLRQRLESPVTSSRDRSMSLDTALSMMQTLIDCDEFQDIATLQNVNELLGNRADLSDRLMQIGDSIVYKLVQWTKRLPFYVELPVEVHTRLLTHRWHELLVLTTSAYQAMHGFSRNSSPCHINNLNDTVDAEFAEQVAKNLRTLQTCLSSMMGTTITLDQLREDVGLMVEKITHVTLMFRHIKLRMEEYVCLKVIIMLNPANGENSELEAIQDRYMTCLKTFMEHTNPQQPTRLQNLLDRMPEVKSAASLLLESKMFYVPFLLNSAIQR